MNERISVFRPPRFSHGAAADTQTGEIMAHVLKPILAFLLNDGRGDVKQ